MIRLATHILLIAAMLTCPFVCRQGLCGCAGAEMVSDLDCPQDIPQSSDIPPCCRKHASGCSGEAPASLPVGTSDDTQQRPCDEPCDDWQCICGGAILKHSFDLDRLFRIGPAFDSHLRASATNEYCGTGQHPLLEFLRADGLVNSGRDICSMHMSFLC